MEKYHTIPHFQKYEITKSGKVRYKGKEKLKSTFVGSTGYYMVHLNDKNGNSKLRRVHRLLAKTFIPNPENKKYVNHKDGNKLNNNLDNLEWVTMHENNTHAFENGLINNTGSNNGKAKLTEAKVREIKTLLNESDLSQYDIAEKYNVSRSCILMINLGKRWGHVEV
jgi:predicted XRE-type DNA-binding protein